MTDNYYEAVVQNRGGFLRDHWAESVATADGNGEATGSPGPVIKRLRIVCRSWPALHYWMQLGLYND
uniref:Uncharacterized protein n=1 Tax=Bionectria ochroleuca TaxID=29856 RepID=A0A0B7KQ72_BIOOC